MEPTPGLEVVPEHSYLEVVKHVAKYPDQAPQFYETLSQDDSGKVPSRPRQICGLNRRTFWILVAAAVVIIAAAAIGGGLGGALSQKNTNTSAQQQLPQTNDNTTTTTTTSIANPLVIAEVGTINGQSVTLYRDCPSSNDTQYSVQFNSTAYEFQKLCNMKAVMTGQIIDYVNQQTATLNDCINLCAAWNENNVTKSNAGEACSSVCWRNTFDNDDYPGQCFGIAAYNASVPGGFSLQADTICDSAIWTNQDISS